jgi:hypothetical protein
VVECLLSKREALSSTPRTTQKKKKKEKYTGFVPLQGLYVFLCIS